MRVKLTLAYIIWANFYKMNYFKLDFEIALLVKKIFVSQELKFNNQYCQYKSGSLIFNKNSTKCNIVCMHGFKT